MPGSGVAEAGGDSWGRDGLGRFVQGCIVFIGEREAVFLPSRSTIEAVMAWNARERGCVGGVLGVYTFFVWRCVGQLFIYGPDYHCLTTSMRERYSHVIAVGWPRGSRHALLIVLLALAGWRCSFSPPRFPQLKPSPDFGPPSASITLTLLYLALACLCRAFATVLPYGGGGGSGLLASGLAAFGGAACRLLQQ